jgi:hypothetical protein
MNYYTKREISGVRRYRTNIKGKIMGYKLEVTPSGTVYSSEDRGTKTKLDSLKLQNGIICCVLPNKESVELINTEKGLRRKSPGFMGKVIEDE